MEIEEGCVEEVHDLLRKHPEGLDTNALFLKSTTFVEHLPLSKCLHRAVQQGTIYKKNNLYFLVIPDSNQDTSPDVPESTVPETIVLTPVDTRLIGLKPVLSRVDQEILELFKNNPSLRHYEAEPKKKVPKVITIKRTTCNKFSDSLPMGNLNINAALGAIALALWKVKDQIRYLTTSDLQKWTGCTKPLLSTRLKELVEMNYIIKDLSRGISHPRYRWAFNHQYPFSQKKDTDDNILNFKTVREWTDAIFDPSAYQSRMS